MKFSAFIDSYLKDVSTTNYTLSTLGDFAFFGFQKFIDDDAAVKVKIAYEVELQVGVTCTIKTNVHTLPLYFES